MTQDSVEYYRAVSTTTDGNRGNVNNLTYLLTPWSRVPLEKLTGFCS